jgi:hypothetical protein
MGGQDTFMFILGIFLGMGAVAVWWSMNTSLLIQGVFS